MDIGQITAYIIRRFSNKGYGRPGITRLTKLLYLFEVEYYRHERIKPTPYSWIYYHYGPYSPDIRRTLVEEGFSMGEEELRAEGECIFVGESERYRGEVLPDISVDDELLITRLVREWGTANINHLLNFVYYETEPMLRAKRGEELDFTKIKKISKEEKPMHIRLPLKKVRPIREGIKKRAEELKLDRQLPYIIPEEIADWYCEEVLGLRRVKPEKD